MMTKPMDPVAAVTKHLARNNMKSPILFKVARSRALLTSVLNACNIQLE